MSTSADVIQTGSGALRRRRPGVITLLAVLKLLSGFGWICLGVAFVAFAGPAPDRVLFLCLATIVFVLGGVAFVCGYGLWTLRPYGRYIQMTLSLLGLIGFPLQTIISILILFYMFKPGAKVLFSGRPIESFGPDEQAQLRSLESSSAVAIVIAVVVASLYGVAVLGIIAAIAIPNFLNAVDRGKQKRTIADLRSIGAALESYAVDNKFYPAATTAAELRPSVEPKYITATPMVDGWGNAFEVTSSTTQYVIFSHGKDGVGDDCTPGGTSRFDDEICFANGQLTRYPGSPGR